MQKTTDKTPATPTSERDREREYELDQSMQIPVVLSENELSDGTE